MATLNIVLDNHEANIQSPPSVSPFNNVTEYISEINHETIKQPLQHRSISIFLFENHMVLFLWFNLKQSITHFKEKQDISYGKMGAFCMSTSVFIPTLERDIPNLINLYMLIPQLFRLKVSTISRVLHDIKVLGDYAFILIGFIDHPNTLKLYNIKKLQMLKKDFNTRLSRILPFIIDTSSVDDKLNMYRLLLLNTRFFDKGNAHTLLFDITTPEKVLKSIAESVSVAESVSKTSKVHMNYDNSPITKKKLVFKIEDNSKQNYFGFDNSKQMFLYLCDCINKATPAQLLISNKSSSSFHFSCGSIGYTTFDLGIKSDFKINFSLDLYLPHNDTMVTLNSTSQKIIHLLTNKYMLPAQIEQYLSYPNPLIEEALGYYPAFQQALENKIIQLIRIKFDDKDFNFGVVQCNHQECQKTTIFMKSQKKTVIKCFNCYITEFCPLCCNNGHTRSQCDLVSSDDDEDDYYDYADEDDYYDRDDEDERDDEDDDDDSYHYWSDDDV